MGRDRATTAPPGPRTAAATMPSWDVPIGWPRGRTTDGTLETRATAVRKPRSPHAIHRGGSTASRSIDHAQPRLVAEAAVVAGALTREPRHAPVIRPAQLFQDPRSLTAQLQISDSVGERATRLPRAIGGPGAGAGVAGVAA